MKTLFDAAQTFDTVRYVSHRGFMPLAPENSLPSFEYAAYLKQWAIETDVHMTRDGVLVCCHNATVDAMFDGTGAILDMTWDELKRLRFKTGNRLGCLTEEKNRMPLFDEYLHICKQAGCVPFIELKTGDVKPVLDAVAAAGFEDGEVVMSTSKLDWLKETRKYNKNMFLHWIFAKEEGVDELAALGNAGLSWNIPNSWECPKEKIDQTHALGLKVCLRAGDTVEVVRHMLDLGLDYIPSNCMHNAL